MLHYERFQEIVLGKAGSMATQWLHVLPAIPIANRNRFVYTIDKGIDIPQAFDMIMLSQSLPDEAYEAYVDEAIAANVSDNRQNEQDAKQVNKGDS